MESAEQMATQKEGMGQYLGAKFKYLKNISIDPYDLDKQYAETTNNAYKDAIDGFKLSIENLMKNEKETDPKRLRVKGAYDKLASLWIDPYNITSEFHPSEDPSIAGEQTKWVEEYKNALEALS